MLSKIRTALGQPITPERYLEKQLEKIIRNGWLAHFQDAALEHCAGEYDAADLIGIGSRETNLDERWLKKPGDNGNGFGLMQADKRSFPSFTSSNDWKDARAGIMFGARVLMQKHKIARQTEGRHATATDSRSGKKYPFFGKTLTTRQERRNVVFAAYNSGQWAHYSVSKGQKADQRTTGKNYGQDVQERAEYFRRELVRRGLIDSISANLLNTISPQPISSEPSQEVLASVAQDEPVSHTQPAQPISPTPGSSEPGLLDSIPANDTTRAIATRAASSVAVRLSKPLSILFGALAAGDVYAWLGVIVLIGGLGWFFYCYRAEIKQFYREKLKPAFLKILSKFS